MKKLIYPLFLISSSVHAGLYLELGITKGDNDSCIQDYNGSVLGCSDNPLGNATIGYQYKNFSAEVEHYSSLTEKDKGLNLFTFKYRFNLTK